MSQERQYWPTDARMAQLRAEGRIPVSALAAFCAATLMSGVFCFATFHSSETVYDKLRAATAGSSVDSTLAAQIGELLLALVLMPTLCAAGAVIVVGVAQTKFFIGSADLRLDLTRMLPQVSAFNPLRYLVRALSAAILTSGLLLGGILVGVWSVRTVLPVLAGDIERLPFWLLQVMHRVGIVAGVVLLAIGGIGVAGARIRFKMRHRMTKAEMEQEGAD